MGKQSDFRITSFQVVDAWRILHIKEKLKIWKSLHGFGGRRDKIIDVCMDL